jgi:chromosomal replication initiation ATPase DnaA
MTVNVNITEYEKELLKYLISNDFKILVEKLIEPELTSLNNIEKIILPICKEYNITKRELFGKSNKNKYLIARQLAITIFYEKSAKLKMPKSDIMKMFNKSANFRFKASIDNTEWELKTNDKTKELYNKIILSLSFN